MSEETQLPVTSSHEPEWTSNTCDFYRNVLSVLADSPCAIGGAFALQKHTGIWRSTKDLDLLLPPSEVAPALRRLRDSGFETRIEDSVWLAKVQRGEYFVDLITGISNACLIVDHSWMARSISEEVLGIPCRVLAAEELIASKIFISRRERFDGADVTHLLRKCGERLDWDRLLQLSESHWQLLYWSLILFAYTYPAHTDIVPPAIWQQLTDRFRTEVEHPQKDTPFRGSLVDPLMFAIDVDEWGERDLYREYRESHPCLLRIEEEERKETNR